jgi:endonuclease/exonuclease/phosphatase family metal-dependent hydrolase
MRCHRVTLNSILYVTNVEINDVHGLRVMPFYRELNPTGNEDDKRTIERLLLLRKQLQTIPDRTHSETLLLATWNIREFDSNSYGKRLNEAIYYMAEIISRFDLVAVQEVNKDLTGLNRLMKILGGQWDAIFTDTTLGKRGNEERMAFLYDKRKVAFGGLAGELVLPDEKEKGKTMPVTQLARTPFICGFQAGWTKFMLATVHIYYGPKKAEPPERINEIRQVAQQLSKRTADEDAWARNLILLGDFNIFRPKNKTFQEVVNAGFKIPEKLQQLPSNVQQNKHYDQIAFMNRKDSLEWTGEAGVFNYYDTVFCDTPEDKAIYMKYMPNYEKTTEGNPRTEESKATYYPSKWRTYQMSDHLVMWVELKIDYSDEYLQWKLTT